MRGSFTLYRLISALVLIGLAGCGGGGSAGGGPPTSSVSQSSNLPSSVPPGTSAGEFTLTTSTNLPLSLRTQGSSPYTVANQSAVVRGPVLIVSTAAAAPADAIATVRCPPAEDANFLVVERGNHVALARDPTVSTAGQAPRGPDWQLEFPASWLESLADPVAIVRMAVPRRVNQPLLLHWSGLAARWARPIVGDRFCVLAHGLSSDASDMADDANAIVATGHYEAVGIFQYDYHLGLVENARALSTLLEQAVHPLKQHLVRLDLAGYSLGGLVLRTFAQDPTLHGQLVCDRVVTLATPHRGTPAADTGWLTGVGLQLTDGGSFAASDAVITDLKPGSSVLERLNANADSIRLTALAGARYPRSQPANATDRLFNLTHGGLFEAGQRSDGIVATDSGAPLFVAAPGAYDATTFADQHHLSIEHDPTVSQRLCAALAEGWNPTLTQSTTGSGFVYEPSLSLTGRFVVFTFRPPNGVAQVYCYDQLRETVELISQSTTGVAGNGHSLHPSVDASGRFVAFASVASNLVGGDTNGCGDVFVRDRLLGTTVRVSLTTIGAQATAASGTESTASSFVLTLGVAISVDGRRIAFASNAPLDPADTNGVADIYLADIGDDTLRLVSDRTGPNAPTDRCEGPAIDARGDAVTFIGRLNQPPLSAPALYRATLTAPTASVVTLVSVGNLGQFPNGGVTEGNLSADGSTVVFTTGPFTSNLDGADTNDERDVYWRKLTTGVTRLVSAIPPGVMAGGYRYQPRLSADGRFVVYVGQTGTYTSSIYGWDSTTGQTAQLTDSLVSNGLFQQPAISTDSTAVVLVGGRAATGSSSLPLFPGLFGLDNPLLTR